MSTSIPKSYVVVLVILISIIIGLFITICTIGNTNRLLTENNILISEIYSEQKNFNKKLINMIESLNSVFGLYLKLSGLEREEIAIIVRDIDNTIEKIRKEY